jgi:hypothetical protein
MCPVLSATRTFFNSSDQVFSMGSESSDNYAQICSSVSAQCGISRNKQGFVPCLPLVGYTTAVNELVRSLPRREK